LDDQIDRLVFIQATGHEGFQLHIESYLPGQGRNVVNKVPVDVRSAAPGTCRHLAKDEKTPPNG
jgi:hypothetical protein